ncbi:MAG: hypothetical protein ABEJ42_06660 [Halobacteriaceae archaeon]
MAPPAAGAVVFAGAIAAQCVVLVWLWGRVDVATVAALAPADETGPPVPAAEGGVVCRVCGATNDAGFRFCRNCAGHLGPAGRAG